MVSGIGTKPTAERIREGVKAGRAGASLFPDADTHMDKVNAQPLKFSEPEEKPENLWHARAGVLIRVWRLPNGRFAENPYRRARK